MKKGKMMNRLISVVLIFVTLFSTVSIAHAEETKSQKMYELSIVSGDGGSVTVEGQKAADSYHFQKDEKIKLQVNAKEGYSLKMTDLEDVEEFLEASSENEISFLMPDHNVHLNFVFEQEKSVSGSSEELNEEERRRLAKEKGVEQWIDEEGYLTEDYFDNKTDLELSEMGVAPLVRTIDLNSEIMLLSVSKYEKVQYGSSIVGYFEVDGYPAMCCEHDRGTPEAGSSTGPWEEITDANLRTVMYYGYTGPGNIFSDYNKGCVGTSLALSYYVRGLSSTGMGGPHSAGAEKVGMSQLIYKAEQKAYVPDGFKVYRVTTNGGTTQRLMFSIYQPKTYTSLAVKKIWDDQENKFGVRPSSITVNLYWWSNVDSTKHLYKTATLSLSNGWYVKWDNLERTDGSVTYEYTAEEEAVANYSGQMKWDGSYESGWTGYLTNKLKTYTSLSVKKIWDDQENAFGIRPDSIKVNLYWWSNEDSTKHLYKTATLSASNDWYVKWDNLERTDGSITYEYTAKEETVPEYSGQMKWEGSYEKGWTGKITNTADREFFKLQIKKENENQTVLEGAEFTLYSDWECKQVVGKATSNENGILSFQDLMSGKKYYLVETKAPEGYRIPVSSTGEAIVYEVSATAIPSKDQFTLHVNGKDYSNDSKGMFTVTGTKNNHVANMTIINTTGKKLPETGSSQMLILLMAAFVAGTAVILMTKRK